MNLIHIQEQLKGLPTQAIMAYANGQNPQVPPYVALAELSRRKQMQSGGSAAQGGQSPTVKDQIEQSTGLMGLQNAQQQQAMQQMAQAPQQGQVPQGAPQGPVQGAPQEGFAQGGVIAFARGGDEGLDDAVYDPVTGALISGGEQSKTDLSISEVLAKVANPNYKPYREGKKPEGIAAVAPRPVRSAPPQEQPAGANVQPPAQQRPPAPPAQSRPQGIAAAPAPAQQAAPPEDDGLRALMTKSSKEAMEAKPNLKTSMAEADAAMPRSKYESEYEQSIRDQRATDLAKREAPKNWYENEGLMATLRGFASADPRRQFGAAGAAYSDFSQKQAAQRAKEDALFREGLGELNKSERERVKSQFDYAVKQGDGIASAKKDAANNVAQLLVAKGNNDTSILGAKIQAASSKYSADVGAASSKYAADATSARGKTPEDREFAVLQKVQTTIQGNPEYKKAAEMAAMPGAMGANSRKAMERIERETWQSLAPDLMPERLKSGIATQTNTGNKNPALAAALAQYK